jgi:hypothetical protein
MKLILFVFLLIVCWPAALIALVLYPFVWLLSLPFRLVGIAVDGVFGLLRGILTFPKLQIIPLGGLGEFGGRLGIEFMNCMASPLADDIIVIDAGLMFPEEELLGVDIVVPDISYLIENREQGARHRAHPRA